MIITSSSGTKLDRARALGADKGINYRATPEWDREVMRLTKGHSAALVLETGGAETFARSLDAVAADGTVFVIGFLSGLRPTIDVLPIIAESLRVQGNNTGSVADLREAVAAIAAHRIKPFVDRIFAMNEANETKPMPTLPLVAGISASSPSGGPGLRELMSHVWKRRGC